MTLTVGASGGGVVVVVVLLVQHHLDTLQLLQVGRPRLVQLGAQVSQLVRPEHRDDRDGPGSARVAS